MSDSVSAFFGVEGLLGERTPDAGAGAGAGASAPALTVLAGEHSPPGTVWLEVDPYLAAGLGAKGLPARFRVRPARMRLDLPAGEPLLFVEDDWGRRPIAVRREGGEVVLGLDPDATVRRTLLEDGRLPGSAVARERFTPSALGLRFAQWKAAVLGRAEPHTGRPHEEDADALRFVCWLLAEEGASSAAGGEGGAGLGAPRPFWPDQKRLAFAVVIEADAPDDLVRARRVDDGLGRAGALALGPAIYARDPRAARMVAIETLEVGIYDPFGDPGAPARAHDLVPEASFFRAAPARRSAALRAALAGRFPLDVSAPEDDGDGGGCGTSFPFTATDGVTAIPETLPSDLALRQRGLSGGQMLAAWLDALDGVRRTGGVALLVVSGSRDLAGGDAACQRALRDLWDEVAHDPEVWRAGPSAIALHWRARTAAPASARAPATAAAATPA